MNQIKRPPGRYSHTFPELARHLPLSRWPDADRQAWEAACKPARGMQVTGPAAHLRPATRAHHVENWGRYLQFLSITGMLLPEESVDARVTPARLGDYIVAVSGSLRASTIRSRVVHLSYMAAFLVPNQKWDWIRKHPAVPSDLEARLSGRKKARCDPTQLVAAALTFANDAEEIADPLLSAIRYRDGLLLALAFWSGLRRKNLAELHLGTTLQVGQERIRVVFDRDAMKNEVVIDMGVPDFLCDHIRRYVDHHRQVLLQGAYDPGAFWINKQAEPLSYEALYGLFKTRSEELIGASLNPHSTRYSLASTLMGEDPRDMDLAAHGLGHKRNNTVQRYYNQSGADAANAHWQKLLSQVQKP